jgi:murein L,D-transpeptidase YcbB/YkuD
MLVRKFLWGSLMTVLIGLHACKNKQTKKLESISTPEFQFDVKRFNQVLRNQLDTSLRFFKSLQYGDTLYWYYQKKDFAPIWSGDLMEDRSNPTVLSVFESTEEHGLYPSFYLADSLRSLHNQIQKDRTDELYDKLAHLEILISDNLIRLHSDINRGRTHPKEVFDYAYQLPLRKQKGFELLAPLTFNNPKDVLQSGWSASDSTYQRYKSLLAKYLSRKNQGEQWTQIDTTGIRKLEPGDRTSIMPDIAKKMQAMGIITEAQAQRVSDTVYNKDFALYVREFQKRFGLFDDGVFGRNTFTLLNISLKDRVEEVMANMERHRWFALPEEPPYLLINIPAYQLTLVKEDSVEHMRVCVGKARQYDYDEQYKAFLETPGKYWLKPRDFETPQIASRVVYMVLNPTWTVPKSIIVREMYHQMRRDSFYLRRNHYTAFYKGVEQNPDTINWRKYHPTKQPYKIVQTPGKHNALGTVKFIFPNPFHIYLHDTPQKSKFKWTERAVSHGCVRVETPLNVGDFLMDHVDEYDGDDFRIMMGSLPVDEERLEDYDPKDTLAEIQPIDTTYKLPLDKPMPIYFDYKTIWFDEEENTVQYRSDVYRKNKYILNAMKSREIPDF